MACEGLRVDRLGARSGTRLFMIGIANKWFWLLLGLALVLILAFAYTWNFMSGSAL